MQPGAGKRKGSAYERSICKRLSLWISEGERTDLLWRATSSGAQTTIYQKRNSKSFISQGGDIASIDPLSKAFVDMYAIECKHYADLQVENLAFDGPCKLWDFWKHHIDTVAAPSNRLPMLIARQNRKKDILMLHDCCWSGTFPYIHVNKQNYYAYVMPLEAFLEQNSYKRFMDFKRDFD
jgi:hypothetical protein